MNALIITGIGIKRDTEGRYCLKDIHQAAVAAGFNRRTKEPGKFFATKTTQELITELRRETTQNMGSLTAPISTVEGRTGTTFVVKELVYAYAMWVSPAFNLKVIRAYDALINGEFIQPSIQHENYWFARRPHWPPIRARVLAGECYRAIAETLHISRGRVARAVRSMIRVGILQPLRVAQMQRGPAKRAALRYGEGWGQRQMGLFEALPA